MILILCQSLYYTRVLACVSKYIVYFFFSGGEVAWFARGLQFERGGHIVHKAYSQIILDRILQLLARAEGGHL